MHKLEFLEALQEAARSFADVVATPQGDWIIKGFIDVSRNVYTLSVDTKVISKVMELLIFPELVEFSQAHDLKMVLAEQQNHYPDITFVDETGNLFAVDLKSSYRRTPTLVNGMTLGAFTGYFRDRSSTKNIAFPYQNYSAHFVLGVIYTKADELVDERQTYRLEQLDSISSVVRDFQFFVQEKYRIASDRPGSGNTKNIGSVVSIEALTHGAGPFAELGIDIFDDYWMYYLTADMARAVELKRPPYTNLPTYRLYKGLE